jgi:hypothetical protein
MPSRPAELSRRIARRLGPAALLAVAPKCLLCVAAYAGLGAVAELGGPELCGAPGALPDWSLGISALAWMGFAGGLIGGGVFVGRRVARSVGTGKSRCA